MSFGGFGGFGQNTQQQQQQPPQQPQQQNTGFGSGPGFGGSTSTGFGSTSNPFGGSTNNTTGGGLFGTTSGGTFGSGGFGSTNTQSSSLFGANQNRGGFGSTPTTTSGTSLFGSNTTTTGGTGFGGFGSTSSNPSSGFGGTATTGSSLFGNKPTGFGPSTTGTSAFGGSGAGGFGTSSASTGGFGTSATGTSFSGQVPPSEGTAVTPFTAFTEKDNAAGNVTNAYQSITYLQPYQRYSFEELRLGDYNQGRRYGNGSGQAGAFGTTAFGSGGFGSSQQTAGFGSTSSPFGTTTTAPSSFGGTQTTGGFGGTSSSLFGATKPATSLFGGTSATSQPSLFGSTTASTAPAGGFGTGTGTGTGTGAFGSGGSLFGNKAINQQQNKPLFNGTPGGGFGSSGFGGQQTGTTAMQSPFGQTPQTGTGAFGGFGNQNQNKGLFGNPQTGTQNQQQGGGLFGSSGTGSSLFGQNIQQQQNTGGSLFGTTNQQGGAGLFGANQQQEQKPSLFGTTTTTPGGGLFGQNTAPQGSGGLFGGNQPQQQQKPSLFGTTTTTPGGGLFGQNTTPQGSGGGLFGGNQSQQQQPNFGGLFGGSQQGQQQQPQTQPQQQQQPVPGSFQASLLDGNAYGNQSIFSGLPASNAPSPGPLATPLSSSMRQKQRTPLPVYKITPNAANRLITPPRRGYGFSYSTYGTPSSASSVNSLGGSFLGGSLRGGSFSGSLSRSFGKSLSTSNLRKSFDPESDSVLAPGALHGIGSRYSGGSLKRLTIDRSLRSDLFARPASTPAGPITNGEEAGQQVDKLKKRVSFDSPAAELNGETNRALIRTETESPEPTPEELGFLRSTHKNVSVNGTTRPQTVPEPREHPEMEQVRGNELAVVPEHTEGSSARASIKLPVVPALDPQPGEYWMKPSREELNRMSRDQLKHVASFTVGRKLCGQVTFDEPVDLTSVDLEHIFGIIVQITVRSITVYPDDSQKPPLGKGLNVPSTLRIENSWPRGRDRKTPTQITSGPLYEKHVERLRRVGNTEFVTYEKETGTWVFRVPHFTTYGLDYDDDEGESLNQSTLSAGPDTATPKAQHIAVQQSFDSTLNTDATFSSSILSSTAEVEDDTFDFKKRPKGVPGAFGSQMEELEEESFGEEHEDSESFLENSSMGSTVEDAGEHEVTVSQQSEISEVESDEDDDMEMAGAYPTLHHTVELENTTRTIISIYENTPRKSVLDLSDDWADQLQRTISPKKQDRDALRELQNDAFMDRMLREDVLPQPNTTNIRQKGFKTTVDLMNSLFPSPQKNDTSLAKTRTRPGQVSELPYTKKPKTFADSSHELTQGEMSFHHSFKPRWGPMDMLICPKNETRESAVDLDGLWEYGTVLAGGDRGVAMLSFNKDQKRSDVLHAQQQQSIIRLVDNIPFARVVKATFDSFIQLSIGATDQADEERQIWQLVNILFTDSIEDDISAGVPPQLRKKFLYRIKKDRLSRFWEDIVRERHSRDVEKVSSSEERAIFYLSTHRIEEACKVLIESGNLHLATLVAQIGRDKTSQADLQKQIESWRQHNVLSEMSEPIRALYELLAGNVVRSEGKQSGALEDRASTFTFSERFQLDWFQAFGLRLWYGITEDDPLDTAVFKYLQDVESGNEPKLPVPSPRHHTSDKASLDGENPLWVLLKIYAVAVSGSNTTQLSKIELPAAFLPKSITGNPLSNRLSFQLHNLITFMVGQNERVAVDSHRQDQLTWDFAWELSSSGLYDDAIFVLLHLSHATDRERGVKEILARFASSLPTPTTIDGAEDSHWQYLTNSLRLPESWLWVSKALYHRDTGDSIAEVNCLIRAKNWNEAHASFCHAVGPKMIIERDYQTLRSLISGFGENPDKRVRGWMNGAAIYDDFLRLAMAESGKRDVSILRRLVSALVAMGDKINKESKSEGLEERVAFTEMSQVVASWCVRDDNVVDLSAVLHLPLSGNVRLLHTAEISRRYYNAVMAGAY